MSENLRRKPHTYIGRRRSMQFPCQKFSNYIERSTPTHHVLDGNPTCADVFVLKLLSRASGFELSRRITLVCIGKISVQCSVLIAGMKIDVRSPEEVECDFGQRKNFMLPPICPHACDAKERRVEASHPDFIWLFYNLINTYGL